MNILVVSPALPVPPTSGGAIRVFNLVRRLAELGETVDLLALDDGSTPASDLAPLARCCRRVDTVVPRKPARWKDALQVARRAATGVPFYVKYVDYPELRARLAERLRNQAYDILHVEHSHLAGLLHGLPSRPAMRTLLSTQNVAFDQFLRMARLERHPARKVKLLMTALPMRTWEPRMAAAFDSVIAVCERDRDLLLGARPGLDIAVVPNGVDTEIHRPLPREGRADRVLIVGSLDYPPNVDAVHHFVERIFPRIRAVVPACTLAVAGRSPPESILRLDRHEGVSVHAGLADIKPLYRESRVALVAVRSGGGSRLKILEALALGTPVVSTRLGCEGIDVRDGHDILVADEPDAFARQVVSLLRDDALWDRLAQNGWDLVRERYHWKNLAQALQAHYRLCLGRPRRGGAADHDWTHSEKGNNP